MWEKAQCRLLPIGFENCTWSYALFHLGMTDGWFGKPLAVWLRWCWWGFDVLIAHPTATSHLPLKENCEGGGTANYLLFFPPTYPKQSILPHKHKGTSVNPAPSAQLMLQVSFYNPRNKLKAVGGLGFCFVFNQPLQFFLWNGKKKIIF